MQAKHWEDECQGGLYLNLLAMVEDHGAVRPAVMVHQAQIWKEANTYSLKTPLVAHGEAITVDLVQAVGLTWTENIPTLVGLVDDM